MNMRQEQFHHFINEFNYLYQQTKNSFSPSIPLSSSSPLSNRSVPNKDILPSDRW